MNFIFLFLFVCQVALGADLAPSISIPEGVSLAHFNNENAPIFLDRDNRAIFIADGPVSSANNIMGGKSQVFRLRVPQGFRFFFTEVRLSGHYAGTTKNNLQNGTIIWKDRTQTPTALRYALALSFSPWGVAHPLSGIQGAFPLTANKTLVTDTRRDLSFRDPFELQVITFPVTNRQWHTQACEEEKVVDIYAGWFLAPAARNHWITQSTRIGIFFAPCVH